MGDAPRMDVPAFAARAVTLAAAGDARDALLLAALRRKGASSPLARALLPQFSAAVANAMGDEDVFAAGAVAPPLKLTLGVVQPMSALHVLCRACIAPRAARGCGRARVRELALLTVTNLPPIPTAASLAAGLQGIDVPQDVRDSVEALLAPPPPARKRGATTAADDDEDDDAGDAPAAPAAKKARAETTTTPAGGSAASRCESTVRRAGRVAARTGEAVGETCMYCHASYPPAGYFVYLNTGGGGGRTGGWVAGTKYAANDCKRVGAYDIEGAQRHPVATSVWWCVGACDKEMRS